MILEKGPAVPRAAPEQSAHPRGRPLLDNGHYIDNGDEWSLLRRAIHAEAGRHTKPCEPLHADMTAFLLARSARPREDSTATAAEAELLGHWLATKIVSAWPRSAELTETRPVTGRIQ
jgi:uncharacterized protein